MTDLRKLHNAIAEITEIARGLGLDFYPMRYEICPASILYTFGAYGMPTRFTHWSFGKHFHKMKLQYDLGLSKIYELVINSNPCYAFLLDSNTLIQNKLIIAHVLAHSDFFKNNARFMLTRKDMVESMAATAERIAAYEKRYGKDEVESFLEAVLAIQEHIDPLLFSTTQSSLAYTRSPSVYDDLWYLDEEGPSKAPKTKREKFPLSQEKDLLLFIEQHSLVLQQWQRDILTMMREEMRYFWPQLETKIMNEGWASYWHQKILREMDLTTEESIEFAKLHANVLQPSKTSVNPYLLGLKIFEAIEEKYNQPTEEMRKQGIRPHSGRDKIFEVRAIESDISFLRNYLSKEVAEKEDLYLFEKEKDAYQITTKTFEDVRDQLIAMRVNGGYPYVVVENGDYLMNGELYLIHKFEETELDLPYLEHVLPYLYQLWGRIVHLETVVKERAIVFSYDGQKVSKLYL